MVAAPSKIEVVFIWAGAKINGETTEAPFEISIRTSYHKCMKHLRSSCASTCSFVSIDVLLLTANFRISVNRGAPRNVSCTARAALLARREGEHECSAARKQNFSSEDVGFEGAKIKDPLKNASPVSRVFGARWRNREICSHQRERSRTTDRSERDPSPVHLLAFRIFALHMERHDLRNLLHPDLLRERLDEEVIAPH